MQVNLLLRAGQAFTRRYSDLLAHQVDAADHFGHRVLDLQPGVHFDEVELAVLIEELDGAGAAIAHLPHRLAHGLTHGNGLTSRLVWRPARSMTDFASERETMVERQLRRRGISEPHILEAFLEVPREEFVSPTNADAAYGDHPLPIEAGQTISQPYIVALMIQAAGVRPGDRVLEVGSGSGYAAAVMPSNARRTTGFIGERS